MKHLALFSILFSLSIGAFAQDKVKVKPGRSQYACLPFKIGFDSMKACQKFRSEQQKGACRCSKL